MGRVIAVSNMKGGVGKTTTVIMLAEALAASNSLRMGQLNKVLVIDLDAQSSASYCIAGDEIFEEMTRAGQTVDAYAQDRLIRGLPTSLLERVRTHVCETTFRGNHLDVDLIACGLDMRRREREVFNALNAAGLNLDASERRVWNVVTPDLEALKQAYDYVILDCAPGMSLLSDIAVRFADIVIATCMPDHLSLRGLQVFIQTTWIDPSGLPMPERPPYVLVTRYQQNIRQHRHIIERLQVETEFSDKNWELFETRVPVSAHLAETLEPLGEFPTLARRYGDLVPNLLIPLVEELEGYLHGH